MQQKRVTILFIAFVLVVAFAGGLLIRGKPTQTHAASNTICSRAASKSILISSGASMACFGPQHTGPAASTPIHQSASFGSNVNAATLQEDVTPSGVQVHGQSNPSIASVGPYVVEAWEDATSFAFSSCAPSMNKEEVTNYGFSANSGKTFTDEGGLPNTDCTTSRYEGDPSVEAWRSGGTAYFYVSSLYAHASGFDVALAACKASGSGSSASISCSQPILVTNGNEVDKPFLSIDPVRGRLYISYTDFRLGDGQIELAVCDIGTPAGGTGSAGGTAGAPVCFPDTSTPYLVVAPATTCENTGAYPAVDLAKGDVYVAWEFNIFTNFNNSAPCGTIPTQNMVASIPLACLTLTATSSCSSPAVTTSVTITSLDDAHIAGYFGEVTDFPRIAVSDQSKTVSIVWNDARLHPLGDIFLQSFALGSLTSVQSTPVQLNNHVGGMHFLPALRNVDDDGDLNVSWYERTTGSTSVTNVVAVLDVNPRTTSTPSASILVTTAPTDWNNVSTDIGPVFGDYTDNYVQAQPCKTSGRIHICTTQTLYVAWSDGRIGDVQPFEAQAKTS